MKKLFIIVLSLLLFMFGIRVQANENTYQGINHINPNDFSVVVDQPGDNASIQVSNSGYIQLKKNVEYFLLPTYINKQMFSDPSIVWSDLPMLPEVINITTFDDVYEAYEPLTPSTKIYSNGIFVGIAFTLGDDHEFIKFSNFTMHGNIGVNEFVNFYDNEVYNIDQGLLLIEADRLKDLPVQSGFNYDAVRGSVNYDISDLYLGEDLSSYAYGNLFFDNLDPVFDYETYHFYTCVDNPVTINDMMDIINLSAYDEIDGNITDQIVVANDSGYNDLVLTPTTKQRTLGEFPIIFTVSDQAGNQAECIITIVVEDKTKPVLDVDESVLAYVREVDGADISIDEIINNIVVTDNYSDVVVSVHSNHYQPNIDILGSYEIILKYEDASANAIFVNVVITNVDTTKPTIVCTNIELTLSYTHQYTMNDIINMIGIVVVDNYDDVVDFWIDNNQFIGNEKRVGVYTLDIKANDSSNNLSVQQIIINVIDDVAPIFYVDNSVFIVEVGSFISHQQINMLLKSRNLVKNDYFKLEIVSDNYTANYKTPGIYDVDLKIVYQDGEVEYQKIQFNVVDNTEEIGFLTSVWVFIKKIFQWIWNIISSPFKK